MIDAQAERLRARVDAARAAAGGAPAPASARPPRAPRLARTVAVASGKGGVGKSTVALGIAMAAAERGVRTALVDADLGLANLDLLAGVRAPRTVAAWLGGHASLSECFVTVAPRLWLLPGASGVARMADLEPAQRTRLVEGLSRVALHVQLMVVDLGAGIGAGTLDVAAAADRVLLVTTPEPTALVDAYGFVKSCARRGCRGSWSVAVNMARDEADGERALARIAHAARSHLGVALADMGSVRFDGEVADAVRARRPVLLAAPRGRASTDLRRLEARLAGLEGEGAGAEGSGFFRDLAMRLGLRVAPIAAAAGVAATAGFVAG